MKRIGRYEICGLLGRGGMSVVYRARLPQLGKLVALKLLHPHPHLRQQLGLEELRQRFLAEAKTMAQLHHPNVVEVWDFDEFDGQPFLVMEYYCNNLGLLIGETYRLENPSRPLPTPQVIRYARQILAGLARLHHADIIHRDLKPFNILLTEEDIGKISDFGLSRLRGEVWSGPRTLMVGSPYYAAPEQEQDPNIVDARSDLYAVGIMLYRMLSGRLPEAHSPSLLPITTNSADASPSTDQPGIAARDLDRAWAAFFVKAIATDPANRFASATSMAKSLDELDELWGELVRTTCTAPPVDVSRSRPGPPQVSSVRYQPLKISPENAPADFDVDPLWRPRSWVSLVYREGSNGVVIEAATRRVWQRSGSPYPMSWQEAHHYVNHLNEDRFADISSWRLPTISELLLLITAVPGSGALCTRSPFDPTQRYLWSADRRSFAAAWFLSAELGFVGWQDFPCRLHVRAVSFLSES